MYYCHIYCFVAQGLVATNNCFVVIGHIATCKSFIAIILVGTKNIYFMAIWYRKQIKYLVAKQ
jgi:hypothetical protein